MADLELPKKVLLIDDDPAVAEGLDGPLRKFGINLVRASDLDTATYVFNQQIFEVAIVELEFAPLPGLALVQKFRQHENKERREIGLIVASGRQRKATDESLAGELGDVEFAGKPLNAIKLLPLLGRALQRRRAASELEEARTVSYELMRKHPGLPQPAIDHLRAKLPKLPQRRGTQLLLGLYEDAGKFQDALTLCEQILAKAPDDIVALNAKGRALLHLGQAERARDTLERADKLAPHNIERVKSMADLYLELKDPQASIGKMKELIALTPEEQDLKFDLFRRLADFGFQEESVGFCREITPPSEVVRYYNNKGVAIAKMGDSVGAVRAYEVALTIYPAFKDNFRVLFNLALAETMQKTPESIVRAITALGRCLDLNPDFDKAKSLKDMLSRALDKAS